MSSRCRRGVADYATISRIFLTTSSQTFKSIPKKGLLKFCQDLQIVTSAQNLSKMSEWGPAGGNSYFSWRILQLWRLALLQIIPNTMSRFSRYSLRTRSELWFSQEPNWLAEQAASLQFLHFIFTCHCLRSFGASNVTFLWQGISTHKQFHVIYNIDWYSGAGD